MTARTPAAAVVPATIGRRVAAYALDVAIAFGIVAVLAGVSAAVIGGMAPGMDQSAFALTLIAAWVVIVLAAIAYALVYTAMQGGQGSIGQRTLRIRLYGADAGYGAGIGFGRALLRNIVWSLAASIVVGYFTPLFDESGKRQGWHDKAAGAVVGDRRAKGAAAAPASAPASTPIASAPVTPAVVLPVVPPPPPRITSTPSTPAAPRATAAAATGMISHVPGITPESPDESARASRVAAAPLSVAPIAPAPATAPVTGLPPAAPEARLEPAAPVTPPVAPRRIPVPGSSSVPGSASGAPESLAPVDDVDATRAAAAVPPQDRRSSDAVALVVLTWDDGTRMAVYGRTLYGRNPSAEDNAERVAVRDETLSLSKTHFEIGGTRAAAWIIDRHSTNGTVLVRDGARHHLVAGTQTSLRPGDRLEFGDRSAEVGAGS